MKLQTKVEISTFSEEINHKHHLLLIGSCFTQSIGEKLEVAKFNTLLNPFGIIYNPVSIKNSFNFINENKRFIEQELFLENGVWKSFYHHSCFSDSNIEKTLESINRSINNAHVFLQNTEYLFITLGTSWIYEHLEKNIIVSNCHKISPNKFNRRLLKIHEIIDSLNEIIRISKNANPNISIIFTVSPVRHLKDGHQANTISKSLLFAALQSIKENNSNIFYFPAYEILMDELRDYRFYADDMIHPSSKAIEYIWESFCNTFFNAETIDLIKEILDLKVAMQHKPFFTETEDYKNFRALYFTRACKLSNKHIFLNLEEEKSFFDF